VTSSIPGSTIATKEPEMPTPHPQILPIIEDPDDPPPGAMPVDPDEGVVQPHIPEDPEHDRMVDPEA
jgi:hypothetical protein